MFLVMPAILNMCLRRQLQASRSRPHSLTSIPLRLVEVRDYFFAPGYLSSDHNLLELIPVLLVTEKVLRYLYSVLISAFCNPLSIDLFESLDSPCKVECFFSSSQS